MEHDKTGKIPIFTEVYIQVEEKKIKSINKNNI